jgi:hypothetical protein
LLAQAPAAMPDTEIPPFDGARNVEWYFPIRKRDENHRFGSAPFKQGWEKLKSFCVSRKGSESEPRKVVGGRAFHGTKGGHLSGRSSDDKWKVISGPPFDHQNGKGSRIAECLHSESHLITASMAISLTDKAIEEKFRHFLKT